MRTRLHGRGPRGTVGVSMSRDTPMYARLAESGPGRRAPARRRLLPGRGRMLRWLVGLGMLALLVFGIQNAYSAMARSNLFRLEQISVVGNSLLTSQEIVARSGLKVGGNLFDTDLKAATRNLLSLPTVRGALLLRQPPGTVLISVEERRPIALVSTPEGLQGLDREGTLFPLPQAALDLPVVTGVQAAPDSMHTAAQQAVLFNLVDFLETLRVEVPAFLNNVSEIHVVSEKEAKVYMVGDGLELRMRFEDAEEQARNFMSYLAEGPARGERPAYVDLRFSNQVVVGEN